MTFLDRVKLSMQFGNLALKSMFSLKQPGPLKVWGGDLLGTDENSVTKPYSQSIWIYRCVTIWQRVAQIPLITYGTDGDIDEASQAAYVLSHPQTKKATSAMLQELLVALALKGEWFLLKEDGFYEGSDPKYLVPIWPGAMYVDTGDTDKYGRVIRWTLNLSNGGKVKFPVEGVIHDKLYNPYNPTRGLSPIEAVNLSMQSDFSARTHNKWMMQRHGRISNLVTFEGDQTEEQLSLYAKLWREHYEGADKAGTTSFLGGGAKVQQLSLSMKDLDWLEGMKLTREEICAAFGIPPNNAGILDKATYSNFEESTRTMWQDTLVPLGDSIASKLTTELVEPSNGAGAYCAFDWDNNVPVLQAAINQKIDRYTKLIAGKVSPKRAAEITGIDLGEINPVHERIWIQMSEIPADDVLNDTMTQEPTQAAQPIAATFARAREILQRQLAAKREQKLLEASKTAQDQSDEEAKAKRRALRNLRGKAIIQLSYEAERQMGLTLKRFFWDQRKAVLGNASKVFGKVKKDFAAKATVLTAREMANELLGDEDWDGQLLKRMNGPIKTMFQKGAKQAAGEIKIDPSRYADALFESYIKSTNQLLKKVNAYTYEAVEKVAGSVLDAVQAGDTVTDLMDQFNEDLKGVFNKSEVRRRTIARTESLRALNGGRFEQMKAAGIAQKEWLTVGDGAVRESHEFLDGKIVPIGDAFETIGNNEIMYPLDPAADAGETINCRCTVVAVFEGSDIGANEPDEE